MSLLGLSKKSDYGLAMLVMLAKRGVGEVVSTAEMVEEKELPRAFISQIAKEFIRVGIVGSKEGKGGGYFLKRDPENIKVREVVEAVEGKVRPAKCVHGECDRSDKCEHMRFMKRLAKDMEGVLDSYSLIEVIGR